jgi:uncharacterized protein YbjT (DUF2867 family)
LKTALIIGSTGLTGSQLLQLLLESDSYSKVITFVKRETGIQHPKLKQYIIDFDNIESYQNLIQGDDFFCTLGTTINKAGSKEVFRKVDFEYPQQFAKIAIENKIQKFLIISSLGADTDSSNFYLKTKGEIENFLRTSKVKSATIFRPSLLLGKRNEFRFGEKAAAFFMKIFSFLLIRKLKKYKPIESKTVAKALFVIAQQKNTKFTIYESDLIQKIGK